jgi:hypothetical protein
MDPYIERYWGDAHATLTVLVKIRLQDELPDTLRARIHEMPFVDDPMPGRIPPFETTHRNVVIIDVASSDRAVTVIEFLSPTNKRAGDGRDKYRQKREECFRGRVNFVEIDLTREGSRELSAKPWQVPPSHQTTYQGCVFRAARPDDRELYAMPLWKPLPTIKIPLRSADPDVLLIFIICQPCRPLLDAADAAELERRLAG